MIEHTCPSGIVRQGEKEDCINCMRSKRHHLFKMLKRCHHFIFNVSQSTGHQYPEALDLAHEAHTLLKRIENDH